ncbi:site-specific DNA-methyltransferase [Paenibacillus sp. P96]|uniref:Site-specific DNA-methyltransferase n=1 Tax=Paenibacillus zeirhizosphaerae TaxID=2987519 RepID=A0ABT9FWP0_9BACL|nr:hypothetical protein [Paenibacillus sp. P96]MDP4099137.1 site-specific DNA-methyltransferase [Paenibacillus sp. P96]
MYRWFCPKGGKVLDPFSGGSVRGIVAEYLGYSYTGIDLRQEQVTENAEQAQLLYEKGAIDRSPGWIQGDSRQIGDLAAHVEADFVFSCLSYADLGVYSDAPADISNMDYADFLTAYREIIIQAFRDGEVEIKTVDDLKKLIEIDIALQKDEIGF